MNISKITKPLATATTVVALTVATGIVLSPLIYIRYKRVLRELNAVLEKETNHEQI